MKSILKWLTLVPLTLVTALFFYRINLGIRSSLWIYRGDHMPLVLAYLYILLSGVFGYFTMTIGVRFAPDNKQTAAKACLTTYALVCCGYIVWIIATEERGANIFREVMAALAAMYGAVHACLPYIVSRIRHKGIYDNIRQAYNMLSNEQWQKLEDTIAEDYPDFFPKLATLKEMNGLERQVCLLIKAEVPPSQMAEILCTSKQNISSVRSRLYHKNFNEGGGAADWDKFISSL